MKGKLRRVFKSGISSALVISMLSPMAQLPVKAEAVDVYIPEVEIEADILSTDVFYLHLQARSCRRAPMKGIFCVLQEAATVHRHQVSRLRLLTLRQNTERIILSLW